MKILEGIIVSTGMNKTIVVEVTRKTPHPLYKKLIKRSKKYKVDNSGFEDITVGSVVRITETRPISKDKYFKVSEILGEAKNSPVKKDTEKEVLEAVKETAVSGQKVEDSKNSKATGKSSSSKTRKENPSSRKTTKGK